MKCLQLLLHLSVIFFYQCPVNSQDQHCQNYMQEGRVECVGASADQLRKELVNTVGGVAGIRDLSIRASDISALDKLKDDQNNELEFSNVEKLQLDSVRMGSTKLPQLLSKFPALQFLLLDNSQEKITLNRETFMPGQPILTLTFNNDGLTDADIHSDAFENIKDSLKALILRENQLTHLPSAITGLGDLRDLDFTGNPIKYFSDETTKQLRSLPQLQSTTVNGLDCQCHLLRQGFPMFVREKRILGVSCSQQSIKFPGEKVSEIDVEKSCNGSDHMKVTVIVFIVTFLLLLFK